MSSFADEVRNYPRLFSLLDVFDREPGYLRSSEATAAENGGHGIVAFGTQAFSAERSEESLPLVSSQPIPDAHAMLLYGFQPQGRGSEVRNRQPRTPAAEWQRDEG